MEDTAEALGHEPLTAAGKNDMKEKLPAIPRLRDSVLFDGCGHSYVLTAV